MIKKIRSLSIPQSIVLAYAAVITIGGLLLWLPVSARSGEWTPFLDAIFTATSATAVTGQITLNTAEHWNYFGKTVILMLIEIGGLGFMTIWVLLYSNVFKRRTNLKQRKAVAESLSLGSGVSVQEKVIQILRFAFLTQLAGAFLLSFSFIPDYGTGKGLYFSIFHSISAFCNAGFDLIGNSLISYQDNPYVLLVIAGLVIIGGLGFIVWEDLFNYPKRKKLQAYTKVVLVFTSALWIAGMVLIMWSESQNGTFDHLPLGKQLVNYFFLAVTPRTAGFANIDHSLLSNSSVFLTIILMFVGASSGSTGGGIKISTLAVILIVVYRSINHQRFKIYNRAISNETIQQAFFIFSAGLTIASAASFILLFTETIPPQFGVEYVLFEVFSVLGTVGLSMGLTPSLTMIGKIIIILLMLIGRVGVMTFLWSLAGEKKNTRINYPETDLLVG
ncbi:MAG: TrkH family potassium uptake protein [Atopostipes suicloacalis]|nr:TrkH family potassium uptake protein [Atopostipes suicloacalis]